MRHSNTSVKKLLVVAETCNTIQSVGDKLLRLMSDELKHIKNICWGKEGL